MPVVNTIFATTTHATRKRGRDTDADDSEGSSPSYTPTAAILSPFEPLPLPTRSRLQAPQPFADVEPTWANPSHVPIPSPSSLQPPPPRERKTHYPAFGIRVRYIPKDKDAARPQTSPGATPPPISLNYSSPPHQQIKRLPEPRVLSRVQHHQQLQQQIQSYCAGSSYPDEDSPMDTYDSTVYTTASAGVLYSHR